MGTTKKMAVLCLVLIMGIVAVMPSTFSWYNHNGEQTGVKMKYTRTDLPVSAATASNITVTTKKYHMQNTHPDGNGDANAVYYDIKGNKEFNGNAISGTQTIAKETSQYYGTVIENAGSTPAYVNLYMQDFKNDNKFFLGTAEPSLRDKGITPTVTLKNMNSVRVYFQWHDASKWNESSATHFVVYQVKGSSTETSSGNITTHITEAASGSTLRTKQEEILGDHITDTYYFDLPSNTVKFYFACAYDNKGYGTSNMQDWYRTNDITDIHAERGYYLTGSADDTTFHAQYNTFSIPGGISVMKYFDTANINPGQKSYVSLVPGIHYTGTNASYTVSAGSTYVKVGAGNGLLEGKSTQAPSSGTGCRVTTTITGSLGDTRNDIYTYVTCPTSIAAMPLAMNIKIPANDETLVVWYVRNESTSTACTFGNIYYTK